jgi:hypothetical protein
MFSRTGSVVSSTVSLGEEHKFNLIRIDRYLIGPALGLSFETIHGN